MTATLLAVQPVELQAWHPELCGILDPNVCALNWIDLCKSTHLKCPSTPLVQGGPASTTNIVAGQNRHYTGVE